MKAQLQTACKVKKLLIRKIFTENNSSLCNQDVPRESQQEVPDTLKQSAAIKEARTVEEAGEYTEVEIHTKEGIPIHLEE